MIKLKLPGSFIRLSGTLSCNSNFVWFSKNARKCRKLPSCGGFCISARSEIHTMSPASLIVFCYLATNMSRHCEHGGYMNIHPHSPLTIDRRKCSGEKQLYIIIINNKEITSKSLLENKDIIKNVIFICMPFQYLPQCFLAYGVYFNI